MNNNEKIQADIQANKIKQGLLLKQSRHLKQWKQRWMVLTKTYLYSFSQRGQYKNPTQIIALKDIQTTKSYYKDQYKKPYTFRVESQQVNLHMSAKTSDQKWAWLTAIQKMIQVVLHPESHEDTHKLIKQTIKMSTAVRNTLQKSEEKERKRSIDFTDNLLKKIRINIYNQTSQFHYQPQIIERKHKGSECQQPFFVVESRKKTQKISNQNPNKQQKIQPKVVQKIVQVPVQRVVEKIVNVPQIVQKVVEKIVYKQIPKASDNKSISQVLKQLTINSCDNPKPLVNFVVYILTSKLEHYQAEVLQYCLDNQSRRFFAQVFLLMMNEQTDENLLNNYLKFVIILYQNCAEYFYSSDLKALIGILIREIQMNRSEFNQYLIMMLLKQLTDKHWWIGLNYRRNDLKNIIKEVGSISGLDNQYLANQLLTKI